MQPMQPMQQQHQSPSPQQPRPGTAPPDANYAASSGFRPACGLASTLGGYSSVKWRPAPATPIPAPERLKLSHSAAALPSGQQEGGAAAQPRPYSPPAQTTVAWADAEGQRSPGSPEVGGGSSPSSPDVQSSGYNLFGDPAGSGAAGDLGGAVGAAICEQIRASEMASCSSLHLASHSERLLLDNERIRKEAEMLLREREAQRTRMYGERPARGGRYSHDSLEGDAPVCGGATWEAMAEAEAPMSGEDGEEQEEGGYDGAGGEASAEDAALAAQNRELVLLQRKRAQRAAKARRIFIQAARLSSSNAAQSSVSSWGLSGMDFAKLAKVAVEVAKTSDALRSSDFFFDLGERQLAMMSSAGVRRRLARYNVLYREGASATCFYVLVGGSVLEHSLDPQWKEPELPPGHRRPKGYRRDQRTLSCSRRPGVKYTLFGMEALVGRPRTSTISVLDDCEILKFSAENLNIRKDGAAKVARKVFDAFLEGELAHTYAFRGMPSKRLKQLVTMLEQEKHEAGEVLYAPGNPGDKVFFLMHGSVVLLKGSVPVATLSAEQGQATSTEFGMPIFGENAMLDRRPRSLTCKILSETTLLVLPLEQWAPMTMAVPDFKARLKKGKEIRNEDLG